jgi:hypothetical protein
MNIKNIIKEELDDILKKDDYEYFNGMLVLRSIQNGDKPDWEPLYKFLKQIFGDKYLDAADAFMWYAKYQMVNQNDQIIDHYRHGISRRYFFIDENGDMIDIDFQEVGKTETGFPKYDVGSYTKQSNEEAFNYIYGDLGKYWAEVFGGDESKVPADIFLLGYEDYKPLRDKLLQDKGFDVSTIKNKDDINKYLSGEL